MFIAASRKKNVLQIIRYSPLIRITSKSVSVVNMPISSWRKIERDAVAWAVGIVTPEEIDKINILNASFLAMHRALDALSVRPEAVIVDGNRFKPYRDLPHATIVKGDGKYLSIAAASILAKTWRDEYMERIAQEHPQYDWTSNKGYPTRRHREAIRRFGVTPYHRMSYNLLGDAEPMLPFEEEANDGER